jgi:CBS domain-containing protein
MLVKEILKLKGSEVFTVLPEETLSSMTALLHTRRVGAFVVTDRLGRLIGVISERDIIRAIATSGASALMKTVADVMTRDVISAQVSETIDQLLSRMTDRRIRHLPVLDEGRLIGIVSIGDLVKSKIAMAEHEAATLKHYISAG